MSTRYAVLKETDDGETEIINIHAMESGEPELHDDDSTAEEIGPGPKIGMIKGGPVASVDGYGFREGDDRGTAALATQEAEAEARDRRQAEREVEAKRASREPSAAKQEANKRVEAQKAAEKKAEADKAAAAKAKAKTAA